jgi:hypothetical protein
LCLSGRIFLLREFWLGEQEFDPPSEQLSWIGSAGMTDATQTQRYQSRASHLEIGTSGCSVISVLSSISRGIVPILEHCA